MKKKQSSVEGDDVIAEINSGCLLMRARLIARVLTNIYDQGLRPFGIGSPQFALLVIIAELEPATRAAIGRYQHQDRSTLTRNIKVILSEGWVQEVPGDAGGRVRPLVLTNAGRKLLHKGAPAWRVAQAKAKTVLGKDGVTSITDVANGIIATSSL